MNVGPIAVGADEAATELKERVLEHLDTLGLEWRDHSRTAADDHYPDVGKRVADSIIAGDSERGILMCGTGIGVCIAANKAPGIRAALCHDTYSAERARKSNDAQVLTMGARVIGAELALTIVDAWLASDFAGGRSLPKVDRLKAIDAEYRVGHA